MINNEERDLIDRFERAYNNIDDYLKKTLGREAPQDFVRRVEQFAEQERWGKQYAYPLKQFGKLRNAVRHEYLKKDVYVAVPTLETVETIERMLNELQNPLKVTPAYLRRVEKLSPDHTLAYVLPLVYQRNYSQFPVYDDNDEFKGLLTENGITRGLGDYCISTDSMIEFKDLLVKDLLQQEEEGTNYEFIARDTLFAEAALKFQQSLYLEALLITHSGKPTESLLGIITRWDILHPQQ